MLKQNKMTKTFRSVSVWLLLEISVTVLRKRENNQNKLIEFDVKRGRLWRSAYVFLGSTALPNRKISVSI